MFRDWHPEPGIYFQILNTGLWMSVTYYFGNEYYPITEAVMTHVVARLQNDLLTISSRHGGLTSVVPQQSALRVRSIAGAQFYFWAVRQSGGPTWGTMTLALGEIARLATETQYLVARWAVFSGDVRSR